MEELTPDEVVLDMMILRAHWIARLKAHFSIEIVGMMNDLVIDAIVEEVDRALPAVIAAGGGAQASTMWAAIDKTATEGFRAVTARINAELVKFAVNDAEAVVRAVERAIHVPVSMSAPADAMLQAVIDSQPFEGKTLGAWWKKIEDATKDIVRQVVAEGIVDGVPTEQIAQALRGTPAEKYADGALQVTRQEANALVRTATDFVSAEARQATYVANQDVVKGWRFVATLDARTTIICMVHDGRAYAIGEGADHRPPLHWGCRSTTVPILKTWAELGIHGLEELPVPMRASTSGLVSSLLTYEQWLRRQTPAVQDAALGPTRAALFRSGALPLDKFIGDDGQPLTLAELRALESSL